VDKGTEPAGSQSSLHFSVLWYWLGWGLVTAVIYLSLTANPPEPPKFALADKLEHLLAYSALMGWFGQLYVSKPGQLAWATGFCGLGIALEFVQGWGGLRFFDVGDMVANALGVLLGLLLTRYVFAGFLQRVDNVASHLFGAHS